MDTLHTLFYFIVAIAVLVAFHEYGHFWAARKVGIKVIRFSIGFGKPLISWQKKPCRYPICYRCDSVGRLCKNG